MPRLARVVVPRFALRGLDAAATYEARNVDAEGASKLTGRELMKKGLLVTIPTRPGAAIVTYKRVE